ncbi:MAG: hypothetical protein RIN56_12295 [Sporomusaceae bacterium]|nr:hypothetical protein [Sporomusaceae bacterium]
MLPVFRVFAKHIIIILLPALFFGLLAFALCYNEKTYQLTTIIDNGVIYENGSYKDIESGALFVSKTKTKYGGTGLKNVSVVDGLFIIKTASESQQEAEQLMDTILNEVMVRHSNIFQMYLNNREDQMRYYNTCLERIDRQTEEVGAVINANKENVAFVALMQIEKNRYANNKLALEREVQQYVKNTAEPKVKPTKIISKQLKVTDVLYKITFLGVMIGFLLGLVYVVLIKHKEIMKALNERVNT